MAKMSGICTAIEESFAFLSSDFGANVIERQISKGMRSAQVTFSTKFAGLRVSYEALEGGIFVMIFPLVDGEVPEYRYWYDVQDFFEVMNVQFVAKDLADWPNLEPVELKDALDHYAEFIRVYLKHFLNGDFSAIPLMDEIVRKRQAALAERFKS